MMNERIKKIAKDAGVLGDWGEDASEGRFFITGNTKQMEQFAELIVQECINIAYEYDKPKLSGPGLAIASNIESHFDIYIEEDGRFVK